MAPKKRQRTKLEKASGEEIKVDVVSSGGETKVDVDLKVDPIKAFVDGLSNEELVRLKEKISERDIRDKWEHDKLLNPIGKRVSGYSAFSGDWYIPGLITGYNEQFQLYRVRVEGTSVDREFRVVRAGRSSDRE